MGENRTRNPELMHAFRNLTKNIFRMLQQSISNGKRIPVKCVKRLFDVSGTIDRGIQSGHDPDIQRWTIQHKSQFMSSKEAQQCIEALTDDSAVAAHLNKMVGSFSSHSRLHDYQIIVKFIETLLSMKNKILFDEEKFTSTFQSMENYFHSMFEIVEVIIPLENFRAEMKKNELGNGWSITELSIPQLNSLASIDDCPLSLFDLSRLRFALYWHGSVPKVIYEERENTEEENETTMVRITYPKIISALRIFKNGLIGFRMSETRRIGWSFTGSSRWSSLDTKHFAGTPYHLYETEIADFRNLLSVILSLPVNSLVEVAIRRLNLANERSNYDDRLIDLMIGFESLFAQNRESIRSTLSRRTAIILQNRGLDLETISKDIKLACDIRSHIVHGYNEVRIQKELTKAGLSKKQFVNKIHGYLSESIKGYLPYIQKGFSLDQVFTNIDSHEHSPS